MLKGAVAEDWQTHAQDAALRERLEVYKLTVAFMQQLALSPGPMPSLERY